MAEPFVTLEEMLSCIVGCKCVVQKRRHFNTFNYGEILGWQNRADNMRWDCFIPGYEATLQRDVEYTVDGVLGVLMTETGNHKIAVSVSDGPPTFTADRSLVHMFMFRDKYRTKKGIDCECFVSQEVYAH